MEDILKIVEDSSLKILEYYEKELVKQIKMKLKSNAVGFLVETLRKNN